MFFIFGWGHTTRKILNNMPIQICTGCHANHLYLTRVREWATLFFIPIFPYDSKYYYLCPNCKMGYQLERDKIEELLEEMDKKRPNKSKLSKKTIGAMIASSKEIEEEEEEELACDFCGKLCELEKKEEKELKKKGKIKVKCPYCNKMNTCEN